MNSTISHLVICILLLWSGVVNGQSEMAAIKGGSYIPLYGRDSLKVVIKDFHMDVYPVTNADYLKFVKKYPKWSRSKVIRLFTDESYLVKWRSDTQIGASQSLKAPVTNVSWFAANAYCNCQGKRLPTIDEWEYAAMANESHADARTHSNIQ